MRCLCERQGENRGGWLVTLNGKQVFLPDDEEGLE